MIWYLAKLCRKQCVWILILSIGLIFAEEFSFAKFFPKRNLVQNLTLIRQQISSLETRLIEGNQKRENARSQLKKIQRLLKLQKLERSLGEKRKTELEKTVLELEARQKSLEEKIRFQRKSIRKSLIAIESSLDPRRAVQPQQKQKLALSEQEKFEAPRRQLMANLVDHGLKEIEVLRIDLSDASRLEQRIQEEKEQLAYLFQDLAEQKGVLELNRQLQIDFLKKKRRERIFQLENYRKLKTAESQVEQLITEFNARKELKRLDETERMVSKAMRQGDFFRLKGRLPLPISEGRVISRFGKGYDSKSGLNIFKKGIELSVRKNDPVRAISSGRVAFSGELPNYGKVVILDHGDHFYSLCAHLGSLLKGTNEPVAFGEKVGSTDGIGTPLYFEIRARNVAVNPLQWVSN